MRAAILSIQHIALAFVFAVIPAAASAQLSLPAATPNPLGPGVRLDGLFYTAPVTVDGATIFRVAVATKAAGNDPVELRAQYIQSAINQILATHPDGSTVFDARDFRVETRTQHAQVYVVATDAGREPDVPVLTVKTADVQYNHSTVTLLASQWRAQLQDALLEALQRRQPAQLKRNYNLAAQVGVVLLLISAVFWVLMAVLGRRASRLEDQAKERQATLDTDGRDASAAAASGAAHQRRRFLALALRAAGPAQRARQLRSGAWLLGWVLLLFWLIAIAWGLLLFPQTAAIGNQLLQIAWRVVAIWLVAAIVNKVADLIIGRVAAAYGRAQGSSEERARAMLRAPTITRALGGFKGFLVIFVAALSTFSVIGIPITSVVTIGGVLALAISFAAQNLVRDLLNGFLVLLEDQYVVGDFVMIGDYNGIVENFTLRVVQIRDVRGNLITIPHSSAIQTVNASRNWSRVDYRVAIDPASDVTAAVDALRTAMQQLAADSKYTSEIVDAVETIGIELISKNGVVLRASMRTAPLRQFELYRALNDLVLREFKAREIALGQDPLPPLPLAPHASPDPV